ncbi:AAA family ATPase [Micromonospora coerulea]|uniref:AAA family ATPase n=1 Tax=Micromonospora coerulea TaxID=47856 RepID=UPI0019066330|nr:AAA family ATPase [Micromonospora veneta]
MIRRLTLKNWRSYEDVTVEFGAGTTFVVASNGVGKTSLVEAARWALFGRIAPEGHGAVRAGAAAASATVELELPDLRVLCVERTLSGKPRRADVPPAVRLDGAPVPHEELERHLITAYGTDPGFLARLAMPAVDRGHDRPTALGLEEHLGRYYGIDGLRTAIEQLNARRKANEAQIKRIKDANSTSSQRLAQLQDDVERTARQVEEATEAHKTAQDKVANARERERRLAEIQRWQDDHSTWTEAVKRLALRVSADLGRPVAGDSLEGLLDERLADIDRQIEAVRVELAVNAAKEAALTANQEGLDAAHDDCPICRRPLDDTTIALAHEVNAQDLSALRGAVVKLKTSESNLLAGRERIKAAQNEWRRIPRPGDAPRAPAPDDEELSTATEFAAIAQTTLTALVEARAAQVQATRELNQARAADEAMRELESLFRQAAILRAAAEATESTLTELLEGTIRPLAAEINQRWKALFPDRGDVNTYPNGNMTRTVNGHPLPYDSFSTGETMGATLLLRLLVVQMATTADFCWFDEPLEHLDPDVRRKVASLLSRVTTADGPLRQVVVTTYEEPLARHLNARDQHTVNLLDVRQSG